MSENQNPPEHNQSCCCGGSGVEEVVIGALMPTSCGALSKSIIGLTGFVSCAPDVPIILTLLVICCEYL